MRKAVPMCSYRFDVVLRYDLYRKYYFIEIKSEEKLVKLIL